MTVEQLCEGICDTRTYRRYIAAERKITPDKIVDFCNRIGISPSDFFYNSKTREREELNRIRDLYQNIVNFDYTNFFVKLKKIKRQRLLNFQNVRYLDFCVTKANHETKKILDNQAYDILCNLCDYPNCLKKSVYDFVDIISLNFIAKLEVKIKKTIALNRLNEILNQNLIYISSESKLILPEVYANVSLYLGRLKQYPEALSIADEGIGYCLKHSNLSALTHLRYMRAYCLLVQGNRKDAEVEALRCLGIAFGKDNKYEIEMFTRVLSKDFNMDMFNLFKKYEYKLSS
ncbi:MAG: hypothetical protein KAU02_03245 [Tenericutes bacterium]|nr:hypothetical protein [Mycoplasmatota bacterium]